MHRAVYLLRCALPASGLCYERVSGGVGTRETASTEFVTLYSLHRHTLQEPYVDDGPIV